MLAFPVFIYSDPTAGEHTAEVGEKESLICSPQPTESTVHSLSNLTSLERYFSIFKDLSV